MQVIDYIKSERNILDKLQHDGIARLMFTFQDADSLYMGLEYCPGGELYEQLQLKKKMGLSDAQHYAAEIVDILEYLRCVAKWCYACGCVACPCLRDVQNPAVAAAVCV